MKDCTAYIPKSLHICKSAGLAICKPLCNLVIYANIPVTDCGVLPANEHAMIPIRMPKAERSNALVVNGNGSTLHRTRTNKMTEATPCPQCTLREPHRRQAM